MKSSLFPLAILLLASCGVSSKRGQPEVVVGVTGDSAMVVCAHPVAAEVGLAILKRGGNAVDAMIATQLALLVTFPEAGNLGGGGFLVYRNKEGKSFSLD